LKDEASIMPKRILSQTLKRSKPNIRENSAEQPSAWAKLRDSLVTLGAASGILTGILWLGGRFYAFGYFGRMTVPIYFLNFPFGEYAENYVIYTAVDIIKFISDHFSLFALEIILLALVMIVLGVIQKKYKELKIREAVLNFENLNNKLLVALSVLLFLYSFLNAYRDGSNSAYYTLTHGQSVAVFSRDLLPLGTPSVVTAPNQNSSLYEFTGLYLLTYNSNKYYLFRELDLTTCKPKEIYIISDNDSISANISNVLVTSFTCSDPPDITAISVP
jgi:hypothetical protein